MLIAFPLQQWLPDAPMLRHTTMTALLISVTYENSIWIKTEIATLSDLIPVANFYVSGFLYTDLGWLIES
jgi:hypothetical protein